VSPSGDHRSDWDPNRVHVEPLVQKTRAGAAISATVVAGNPLDRGVALQVHLAGRGILADQQMTIEVPAQGQTRRPFTCRLPASIPPGRHIFAYRVDHGHSSGVADCFFALDVE
jgi:hypothetical protein